MGGQMGFCDRFGFEIPPTYLTTYLHRAASIRSKPTYLPTYLPPPGGLRPQNLPTYLRYPSVQIYVGPEKT